MKVKPVEKMTNSIPTLGSQNNTYNYLGVDPGVSGGLALISETRVECYPMPATLPDLWDLIQSFPTNTVAALEKVGGYRKDNPSAGIGSAMFKFGTWYGAVLMALYGRKIPFRVVAPATWQASTGVGKRKKDEKQTMWKSRLKARAQELNPGTKVTLYTADALLIAGYCQTVWGSKR